MKITMFNNFSKEIDHEKGKGFIARWQRNVLKNV
ncbi:Uncharacterised protein [Flavobacterium hibernum]|nr:Uncharacterised protein [Flavobacterium hibernum]